VRLQVIPEVVTELSKPQRDLLAKLDITPPKQIIELAPASR
jgi:hypothetical protein